MTIKNRDRFLIFSGGENSPSPPLKRGNVSVFCFDFDVLCRDEGGEASEDREDGRKHVEAVLVKNILKTKMTTNVKRVDSTTVLKLLT